MFGSHKALAIDNDLPQLLLNYMACDIIAVKTMEEICGIS